MIGETQKDREDERLCVCVSVVTHRSSRLSGLSYLPDAHSSLHHTRRTQPTDTKRDGESPLCVCVYGGYHLSLSLPSCQWTGESRSVTMHIRKLTSTHTRCVVWCGVVGLLHLLPEIAAAGVQPRELIVVRHLDSHTRTHTHTHTHTPLSLSLCVCVWLTLSTSKEHPLYEMVRDDSIP